VEDEETTEEAEGEEGADHGEGKVMARDKERSWQLNLNLKPQLNKSTKSLTMAMTTWDILRQSLKALQGEVAPDLLRENI